MLFTLLLGLDSVVLPERKMLLFLSSSFSNRHTTKPLPSLSIPNLQQAGAVTAGRPQMVTQQASADCIRLHYLFRFGVGLAKHNQRKEKVRPRTDEIAGDQAMTDDPLHQSQVRCGLLPSSQHVT
ncbi:hypothetical protein VNO77_09671 [Canavalia gladiata]|uniref:Uncharacterized protein n=1 Tax=Canavalia gladiata TaxID=3824 RepID=A0AAN9R1K6_CANGL